MANYSYIYTYIYIQSPKKVMANIHGLTIALLRFDQWLCGILRDSVEKTLLDKRQITHVFDVGIWVWKFYGATMENYRSYYVMLYCICYTCGKTISKPDGLSSFPLWIYHNAWVNPHVQIHFDSSQLTFSRLSCICPSGKRTCGPDAESLDVLVT
jgi:hypothetical protein